MQYLSVCVWIMMLINFAISLDPDQARLYLQTVWTQIRPYKNFGLIWVKTVRHSDTVFLKECFKKVDFEKNQQQQ